MSTGRRYRPVDCAMRGDAKFRALSAPPPNAQTLWVHLITCGHDRSIPGLMGLGLGLLSEDLGWSAEDVRRCLAEIEAQGMVEVDPAARVIWLPKAVAPGRNEPRSPSNVVAMSTREWLEVPECALKWRAWRAFAAYLAERGEDFLRDLIRTMPARAEDRLYAESLIKSGRPKVDPKARPKARPKATPSKKEGPPPSSSSSSSSSSPSTSPSTSPSKEEEEEKHDSGGRPPVAPPLIPDPVAMELPLQAGKTFAVTEGQLHAWASDFSGVDVHAELGKLRARWDADPRTRPRTRAKAEVVKWLTHAANFAARDAMRANSRSQPNSHFMERPRQENAAQFAWRMAQEERARESALSEAPTSGQLRLTPGAQRYTARAPPEALTADLFGEHEEAQA